MTPTDAVATKLVHTMAHALRHDPEQYGLEPDAEGWVSFEDLVIALRFGRREWMDVEQVDIVELLTATGSDRFEFDDARIRAAYGHSIALDKPPPIQSPPTVLFHGTDMVNYQSIMENGLLPMNRQFVHLTSDTRWVLDFVRGKQQGIVFRVNTGNAQKQGIIFRRANAHVWLSDRISAEFLFLENNFRSNETIG